MLILKMEMTKIKITKIESWAHLSSSILCILAVGGDHQSANFDTRIPGHEKNLD